MYLLQRLRYQLHIHNICILLEDTVLVSRMYRSFHASTASAPSMRASEPIAFMAAPPPVDDAGNVKVVVRCRAFLKRGKKTHLP